MGGWLVDETDAAALPHLEAAGLRAVAVPLWMTGVADTSALARSALKLALEPSWET